MVRPNRAWRSSARDPGTFGAAAATPTGATLAPSLHNSQPWRFAIGAAGVEVRADRTRQLEVLDPDGRELLISVGAALFTLRLAIRGTGHRPDCRVFPDPDDADLAARVALGPPLAVTPAVEALLAAVPHRHTNRWPFARSVVPQDALDHLRDAARREGAAFDVARPGQPFGDPRSLRGRRPPAAGPARLPRGTRPLDPAVAAAPGRRAVRRGRTVGRARDHARA